MRSRASLCTGVSCSRRANGANGATAGMQHCATWQGHCQVLGEKNLKWCLMSVSLPNCFAPTPCL